MRRLHAEEKALWEKVVATVRPMRPHGEGGAAPKPEGPREPPPLHRAAHARPLPPPARAAPARPGPGTTLDAGWDRRLARGLVAPDMVVDLHGHHLDGAYRLLDDRLDRAVRGEARLLLLVTGKPPASDRRPVTRGAIRAAVGGWLAASRHAGAIAAVRGAHPRHGGAGALYIVLRRRRG